MINFFFSSENENNSFDDNDNENKNNNSLKEKEKEICSFLSPYITTISDFKQPNNEPFDFLLDKDYEELYELFPYNKDKIKEIKEEDKLKEIINKKRQNNYIKKFIIKKPDRIFNIKKEIKLGRPKKNTFKKGKHDKFQKDNVIRRFKAQFVQNIYNFINFSFICNSNHINSKPINILQKICACDTKSISKSDNLKWFNSKIKDIFSQKVSTKFVCYESNYNFNLIKNLYENNVEKRVIQILEKTVKEMWNVYINDDKDNDFPGFNTIKYDIKKFRDMNEPEEYIKLYIEISNNFEKIFHEIKPRKKRNKDLV